MSLQVFHSKLRLLLCKYQQLLAMLLYSVIVAGWIRIAGTPSWSNLMYVGCGCMYQFFYIKNDNTLIVCQCMWCMHHNALDFTLYINTRMNVLDF